MAEPVTHATLWLTLSSIFSAAFGFVFDVPGSTVFAAAAGAFLAVRLGSSIGFWRALRLVAVGTFVGAILTGLFISWAGAYPQRGVALVISFVLIYCREELPPLLRTLLKIDTLRDLLKGLKKS